MLYYQNHKHKHIYTHRPNQTGRKMGLWHEWIYETMLISIV